MKNERDGCNIKVCNLRLHQGFAGKAFQLSYKLKELCFKIAYFLYTKHYQQNAETKETTKIVCCL